MNKTAGIRFLLIIWGILVLTSLIRYHVKGRMLPVPVTEEDFAAKFFHKDSLRPTVNTYPKARIGSTPELEFVNPSILVRIGAPGTSFK